MKIASDTAGEAYVMDDDGVVLGMVVRGLRWNMYGRRSTSRLTWFVIPADRILAWGNRTEGLDPQSYSRGWAHTRREAAGLLAYHSEEAINDRW